MSTNELTEKIRTLRELQALIEEAQAEMLSRPTWAILRSCGQGNTKVTWTPVTSSRLDPAALRAALPEVAARFTRTSMTRHFVVA